MVRKTGHSTKVFRAPATFFPGLRKCLFTDLREFGVGIHKSVENDLSIKMLPNNSAYVKSGKLALELAILGVFQIGFKVLCD